MMKNYAFVDGVKFLAVSDFVRRQTAASEFSYTTLQDLELLKLVVDHFSKSKKGYRDGVCLVSVPPEKFFTAVCQLEEGDKLSGAYRARREGEKPRKAVYKVGGEKMPAKHVDIVLYHKDVLAEDNDRSSEAEWEIISINASPTEGEMPIPTGALIANHLHLSGGTQTNMSNDEFVELLRKSVEFWGDKCLVEPKIRSDRCLMGK